MTLLPSLLLGPLLACHPGGSAGTSQPDAVSDEAPVIASLSWDCDVDGGEWAFEVQTDRWTGGAYLWLATDGNTWERHAVLSQEAARDGSSDLLAVDLSIVGDWRDASSGSSTRFLCSDEPDMAFQISVYTQDGSSSSDCRRWGQDGVLDQIDSVLDCDIWLESGDTGS